HRWRIFSASQKHIPESTEQAALIFKGQVDRFERYTGLAGYGGHGRRRVAVLFKQSPCCVDDVAPRCIGLLPSVCGIVLVRPIDWLCHFNYTHSVMNTRTVYLSLTLTKSRPLYEYVICFQRN